MGMNELVSQLLLQRIQCLSPGTPNPTAVRRKLLNLLEPLHRPKLGIVIQDLPVNGLTVLVDEKSIPHRMPHGLRCPLVLAIDKPVAVTHPMPLPVQTIQEPLEHKLLTISAQVGHSTFALLSILVLLPLAIILYFLMDALANSADFLEEYTPSMKVKPLIFLSNK
jgi:hypothetical protein